MALPPLIHKTRASPTLWQANARQVAEGAYGSVLSAPGGRNLLLGDGPPPGICRHPLLLEFALGVTAHEALVSDVGFVRRARLYCLFILSSGRGGLLRKTVKYYYILA